MVRSELPIWLDRHDDERKRSVAILECGEVAARVSRVILIWLLRVQNSLSSIRLNADALRRAALDPRLRTCLERIDRQTAAITRIVEDIGEASRLAHRKVSIEREQLDVRMVLREVLEECQARLDDANLVPRCEMPESPVVVSADQVRLRQIFDNLLSNAIKFSELGGVITVRLKADDINAIVEISDTGRGFDENAKETIFEPFEQRSEAGSRGYAGLGLGLAISRQLVELLGGTLTAHSEGVGRGATFTLTLPRSWIWQEY
jgi:signal transduction histidine kinase